MSEYQFHHFTSIRHSLSILSSGVLLPTESNVGSPSPDMGPYGANYGPPVVWLLDTTDTTLGHGLTPAVEDKTAVRITVDVPAIRWLDWGPASRMNLEWRKYFIRSGGGPEAMRHWYVWPAPIMKDRWTEVAVNGISRAFRDGLT